MWNVECAMKRIRVLVVEDSLTVRKRIVEVLESHAEFEVVGEAEDGKRGIELCTTLRPDVITLDMMMPVMTGLAATEYIMAYCPTPILIVSASTNRGELFRTYEALAAGAVDVLDKPRGDGPEEVWNQSFISAVRMVSRIKVITHPRARLRGSSPSGARLPLTPRAGTPVGPLPEGEGMNAGALSGSSAQLSRARAAGDIRLIAIGASTGGPAAVLEILHGLPANFPLPILLVMHIGEPFAASFAEWLDSQSPLRVAYAKDGEALPAPGEGRVIMAPPDVHLILKGNRLCLTKSAERHSCRPSVDVLFESLAQSAGKQCAACLLTGMGRDGAAGMLAIRNAGGATFAQDESTSVVWGMPRESIEIGGAERVLRIDEFAPMLMKLAEKR